VRDVGRTLVTEFVHFHGVQIDANLYRFVVEEALPGTGFEGDSFWQGLFDLIQKQARRNRELLAIRSEFQTKLDAWHRERRGGAHDPLEYRQFLEEIGYLEREGRDFEISTHDVDPEIADVAGPQRVVPVTNARYALNAANARWAADREYTAKDGSRVRLPGRALMLVRNVGHLMTTDAVIDRDGNEAPEGLLDAMVTVVCALHDLGRGERALNSRHASVYVVKPKMHGPTEAAFTDAVFSQVEEVLGLPHGTVKIGLMDEERRTSLNLKECIRALRSRLACINTGFPDRTGDEIHTSMEAGPMVPKSEMKSQPWFLAYEDWNVDVGLRCGLSGRAQIGKGMWVAPDLMCKMLAEKIGHPQAGANCAWYRHQRLPRGTQRTTTGSTSGNSRTAWLVSDVPRSIRCSRSRSRHRSLGRTSRSATSSRTTPRACSATWSDGSTEASGARRCQDLEDVALMEDRATCRISSQHIANWLRHGVVTTEDVSTAMKRMAVVVDRQNTHEVTYVPMAPAYDGPAFKAACDLVFGGAKQSSGYTEPILHARRREWKQMERRQI
jgi:malate synthase